MPECCEDGKVCVDVVMRKRLQRGWLTSSR
jgi:hypothetical protein